MEGINKNNIEKRNLDPMDIPKTPNPMLEQYVKKVFESNPDALFKKNELSDLLNSDPFDEHIFRKQIDDFEVKTKKLKGYEGQYAEIETVKGKHGKLFVYHFRVSDSVSFGYDSLK